MQKLIEQLTAIPGPSGYEQQIRAAIRAEVEPYADDIQVDALGNLIVRKGQKAANGKKIMLAAHMDEIGIIASHIDENGFVRFSNIGGVFPRYALGGHIRFLDGTRGVIGSDLVKDPYEVPGLDQMFVDVGATSAKDSPVKVGDVAAFERSFTELGSRLVSKALDDRVSCAVMIEVLRQIKETPHEIYFVFTTQEEVGVRGAATSAFALEPELGFAIDVTRTGDTPKGIKMAVELGKGPAIKVKDAGAISDPRVVDWMVSTAQKAKIPYQLEVLLHGGTDARSIQLSRGGVPAGCISIPCRYIHSPSEMVDLQDVRQAVQLTLALLSAPVHLEE